MAFLPLFIITYYVLSKINPVFGKIALVIGSIIFYIYSGWKVSVVLGISILINYGMAIIMVCRPPHRKILLFLNSIFNIGILLYFKYFNFFITNINTLFSKRIPLKEIVLPLGISFFTFQQIMYVVNISKGEISLNLLDYLAYILYFPKILMGPLNEPKEFISQLNDSNLKHVNWDNIACGIKTFSFGLFKKLVLADTFAIAVNWGYSNFETASSVDWILIMLFYTFEIYFDFSGYTDMAVGISSMLNIQLPINFDSPYKAISIRDFWKRWHISLTDFFTGYIYVPLGGSRKGRFRTYYNTILVFFISGIWHGANWTFILWGILHGTFSVLDRVFEKQQQKLSSIVRWSLTFFAVNILWLLFRSDSIMQWFTILKQIFFFQNMTVSDGLIKSFILPETAFLLKMLHLRRINEYIKGFSILLFTLAGFGLCLIPENNYKNFKKNNCFSLITASIAFVWSFLCLSSESVFVYFNF